MAEQTLAARGRTLLAGKIVSDFGQSSIDCIVRRLSGHGATVTTESPLGIPKRFQLLIVNDGPPRQARLVWQSGNEIGLEFETSEIANGRTAHATEPHERHADSLVRNQMLALRSAMDEIISGVVLLDADLRAQFINKAFRRMWALPDAIADSKPSFISLMHYCRDNDAYEIDAADMDGYIAERVGLIRAGDPTPRDLRRTDGTVLRLECAVLPNGGRMLHYTDVTDIVRHVDELELLRNALDRVSDGVMLLDANLKAQFLNRKVRDYFGVTNEHVASHPTYLDLMRHSPLAAKAGLPPDQLEAFLATCVEAMRSATPAVHDAKTADGRVVRVHVAATANGGRMANYCDITDLIKNAEMLETLATVDSMTGLYNRRHFMVLSEAEWSRFQRYRRPLSILMLDIDHFKSVNDRYGHAVGDQAIASVAAACLRGKRNSDIAGRLGGEEFAVLLPETDAAQAMVLAERIRESIATQPLFAHETPFNITVSAGIAQASVSMSGIDALVRNADAALYRAKETGRNRVVVATSPAVPTLAAE